MNRILPAAALALAALSGCSLIASVQDRIGSAVERYCEEEPAARDAFYEYVNARTAPNHVAITCAGDTPPSG